jgi:hypothetical protein
VSATRRFPHPLLLAVPAIPIAIALTFHSGKLQALWSSASAIAKLRPNSSVAAQFRRVEDLPLAPLRAEDLPVAPLEAVRVLMPDELTPELVRKADEVLWSQDPPYGAQFSIEASGRAYIGRIERHFHEIGGPLRPWGPHKGVTLYAAR